MSIKEDNQQLPAATDSFWASEWKKEALEMHYMKWVSTKYTGEKPTYIGGSFNGDICGCLKIMRGHSSTVPSLRCEH